MRGTLDDIGGGGDVTAEGDSIAVVDDACDGMGRDGMRRS